MARQFLTGEAAQSYEEMCSILNEGETTITLEEGERQAALLALALLSLQRPGWLWMLNTIALKMDNDAEGKAETFERFRGIHGPTERIDEGEGKR